MAQYYSLSRTFTQEDLNANKEGKLSTEQRLQIDRLFSSGKSTEKFGKAFFLIYFIGMFCAAYFSDSWVKYHIDHFTLTGMAWLALAYGLPVIIYFAAKKLEMPAEESYKVHAVNGPVQKLGDSESSYIKINKIKILAAGNIYDVIEEQATYTVYYIEFTSWRIILSFEK